MHTKTIILIDDDDIFVYLTSKVIAGAQGLELMKVFGNGLDALHYLKAHNASPGDLPEIILLDLSMPIMDGWQFLESYLPLMPKFGKKITLYIVSSSITPADISRARAIEAVCDYIIKPITSDTLTQIAASL